LIMNEEPLMIQMTSTNNAIIDDGVCCTLTARMGTGGNQVNAVLDEARNVFGDTTTTTMVASAFKGPGNTQDGITIVEPRSYQDVTGTLNPGGHPGSYNGQDAYNDMLIATPPVVFDKEMYNCGENAQGAPIAREDEVSPTCRRDDHPSDVCYNSIVRRLTPLECERLQGYPDGWTDIGEWTDTKGKRHKEADSPRYKALGNSIALPFWHWMLGRMSEVLKRENPYHAPTLGSLFDGIGGFPVCWEDHNGKGTARWASEIEEFPIAVTKLRFPEPKEEDLPEWLT